jgi:excisionase family DNA binding protein
MKARRQLPALEPVAVRIPQAAAMLGIGRSTLYLCIAAGEIEVIKIGRATLVPVDSLNRFVSLRRKSTSASTGAD